MLLFNLPGVFEHKKAQTWLRGVTFVIPPKYVLGQFEKVLVWRVTGARPWLLAFDDFTQQNSFKAIDYMTASSCSLNLD